ncbi:MAG: DMT family transporter [Synergistales bacterium]|nr:DMT family transporter [Synergistales bacterium]
MDKHTIIGLILALAGGSLWGTLGPSGKALGELGVAMETVVFFRAFIGFVGTAAFFLYTNPRVFRISLKDIPFLAFYGGIAMAITYGGFFMALNTISVALTEIVFYTYPLMVIFGSILVTLERPNRYHLLAAFLTLSGVALAVSPHLNGSGGVGGSWRGIAWAFSAAVGSALYVLFGRRSAHSTSLTMPSLFLYGLLFGTISLGIGKTLSMGWQDVMTGFSAPQWGWLLFTCLVGSLLGYALFFLGLHRISASSAGVVGTVEVVVAVVLAAVLQGTAPVPSECAGAALIIGSILIVSLKGEKRVGIQEEGTLPG